MDLTDDETKREFSLFINERKRLVNFTNEKLAGDLGWNVRTVQRYMRMHNNPGDLQGFIPDKSYIDILTALGTSHAEFEAFRAGRVTQTKQDATADAPSQSTGAGTVHIGSIQISGEAQLHHPNIGVQTVNNYFDGEPRERDGK